MDFDLGEFEWGVDQLPLTDFNAPEVFEPQRLFDEVVPNTSFYLQDFATWTTSMASGLVPR